MLKIDRKRDAVDKHIDVEVKMYNRQMPNLDNQINYRCIERCIDRQMYIY